ncbi:MAG: phosphatidylglycerophosphatase A family protein [Burkholderiales bacterium]
MKPNLDAAPAAPRKPRLALAIATCFGVGYIPKSPGTFGSIAGAGVALGMTWMGFRRLLRVELDIPLRFWTSDLLPAYYELVVAVFIAIVGVVVANRVAKYARHKDPQHVVIDEVSGQLLTYCMPFTVFNWKSFVLGFILFRVFDIWKPFPVRQAEKLPGGWGIMADDWVAAVYAALGLWVARYLGL